MPADTNSSNAQEQMLKIEEPAITIHGQPLTTGQAMTVRVALQSFATSLQEDGLGRDQHGLEMTEAYLARIREINLLMKIQ